MKALIPFIFIFFSCNTKLKPELDNGIIIENLIKYYKVQMPQQIPGAIVETIDSLEYSMEKFTEKERLTADAISAITSAIMWRSHPIDRYYTGRWSKEYCMQKYNEYKKIHDSLKINSETADSVNYSMYRLEVYGKFTKQDMVQYNFRHKIFVTKEYKFVEADNIIAAYWLPWSLPKNTIMAYENIPD